MARGSGVAPIVATIDRGGQEGELRGINASITRKNAMGDMANWQIRTATAAAATAAISEGDLLVTPPGGPERHPTSDEIVGVLSELTKRRVMASIGHGTERVAIQVRTTPTGAYRVHARTQEALNHHILHQAQHHEGHASHGGANPSLSPEELRHHLGADTAAYDAHEGNQDMVSHAVNHAMDHVAQAKRGRVAPLPHGMTDLRTRLTNIDEQRRQQLERERGHLPAWRRPIAAGRDYLNMRGGYKKGLKKVDELGLVSMIHELLKEKDDHGHAKYSDTEVREILVRDKGFQPYLVDLAWEEAHNPERGSSNLANIVKTRSLGEMAYKLLDTQSPNGVRKAIIQELDGEGFTSEEKERMANMALEDANSALRAFKQAGKAAAKVTAGVGAGVATVGVVAGLGAGAVGVKTVQTAWNTGKSAARGVGETVVNGAKVLTSPLVAVGRVAERSSDYAQRAWTWGTKTPEGETPLKPAGYNPFRGIYNLAARAYRGTKKAVKTTGAVTAAVLAGTAQGLGEGVVHDLVGLQKDGVSGGILGLGGSVINGVTGTATQVIAEGGLGLIDQPLRPFKLGGTRRLPFNGTHEGEQPAGKGGDSTEGSPKHDENPAHHRDDGGAKKTDGAAKPDDKGSSPSVLTELKGGQYGDAIKTLCKKFDIEGMDRWNKIVETVGGGLGSAVNSLLGIEAMQEESKNEGHKGIGHHFGDTLKNLKDEESAKNFLRSLTEENLNEINAEFGDLIHGEAFDKAIKKDHHAVLHKLEALCGKGANFADEKQIESAFAPLFKAIRLGSMNGGEVVEEKGKTLRRMLSSIKDTLLEQGKGRVAHLNEHAPSITLKPEDYKKLGAWIMKNVKNGHDIEAFNGLINKNEFRGEYEVLLGDTAALKRTASGDDKEILKEKLNNLLNLNSLPKRGLVTADIVAQIQKICDILTPKADGHGSHGHHGAEPQMDLLGVLNQLRRNLQADASIVDNLYKKEIQKMDIRYPSFAEDVVNKVSGEAEARGFLKGLDLAKLRSDFAFIRTGALLDASLQTKAGRKKVKDALQSLFGVQLVDYAQTENRIVQDLKEKFASVSSDPKVIALFGNSGALGGFYQEVLQAISTPGTSTPPTPAALKSTILDLYKESPELKAENYKKFGEWVNSTAPEDIRESWAAFDLSTFRREYMTFLNGTSLDAALRSDATRQATLQKLQALLGTNSYIDFGDLSTLFGALTAKLDDMANIAPILVRATTPTTPPTPEAQKVNDLRNNLNSIMALLNSQRLERLQGVKQDPYNNFTESIAAMNTTDLDNFLNNYSDIKMRTSYGLLITPPSGGLASAQKPIAQNQLKALLGETAYNSHPNGAQVAGLLNSVLSQLQARNTHLQPRGQANVAVIKTIIDTLCSTTSPSLSDTYLTSIY